MPARRSRVAPVLVATGLSAAAYCGLLPAVAAGESPAVSMDSPVRGVTAAAQERAKSPTPEERLAAMIAAVEADPGALKPHDDMQALRSLLASAARRNKDLQPRLDAISRTIDEKYAEWERRFPEALGTLYGRALRLYGKEDPAAKSLLLQIVRRDPNIARVYFMLSVDAERWGDAKAGSDYMRKAAQLDPENPDYAFYYANGLEKVAPDRWEAASQEVARRFPASERGAQALYWLGARSEDDARRIAVWEQLRAQFPPDRFRWSASGTSGLFEAYLRTDPFRAVKLAQEMQGGTKDAKAWADKLALAQAFIEADTLLKAGGAGDAASQLDKLTADRFSSNAALIRRIKAQVMAEAGRAEEGYGLLAKAQSMAPDDETLAALRAIGGKLGKSADQVDADVRQLLESGASPAPAFDLEMYTSDGTISLEKLRGKVVFVTFWFPGCGPCRAEFPHFEKVVRQFEGRDLAYLGINGMREQDDYVAPFMKSTGYSFIPLKGTEAVTGQEGYKVRAYPSNFLIDRQGRIVYSNFRTTDDEASQRTLARMIESLL